MSTKNPKEGLKMCREHRLKEIQEKLESAPDADVESIYWMVLFELGEA